MAPEEAELRRLLDAARGGDAGAMTALRERGADPPLWRGLADLSARVEAVLIRAASGSDLLLAEGLTEALKGLRHELGHPSATRIERLLIERITLSWLEVQYLD